MSRPQVSFVIATYNRRDVLAHTLDQLRSCGLAEGEFETLVVDNASTDGTSEAVRREFPSVIVLRQRTNRGPCAKNAALAIARGEFVVFLDDDSFPQPGSLTRMVGHFTSDARLGAAVFTVTLPDGSRECSAYPEVCIGCGTGFRRQALIDAGGLPEDFFMAAEEYELSLRLLDAGWRIRRFDDLHVTHLKSSASRYPSRIARLDARNNVLLAMRCFPESWRMRYVRAWLERYRLMAIANGNRRSFWVGAAEGLVRGACAKHWPLSAAAFEQFAKIELTTQRLHEACGRAGTRMRNALFIDLGKNYPAYRAAARDCGLQVVAIADARLGGRGFRFGGVPILSDAQARQCDYDAAIISNLSPVHAAQRRNRWRETDPRPVIDLFEPGQTLSVAARAA